MKKNTIVSFLFLLTLMACSSSPERERRRARLLRIAETVGDVWLQTEGSARLRREAPDAFAALDTNNDGVLSTEEIRNVAPESAAAASAIELLSKETNL
ncbi:MAG: EF-hand domain-containing protein [bacterium]|nr:EF-hand domain-containing protein [bacterium]